MKKRPGPRSQAELADTPARASSTPWWIRIEAGLSRHAVPVVIALVLIATARIAATYNVFSHVYDEPAHIACGMEWLERGTYTYEPQHPPLARVLTALLPKIAGAHGWQKKSMWDEGTSILSGQKNVDRTLALARIGVLPLFWTACWMAFAMGSWIAGRAAGVFAVLLLSITPGILANAGLATTDMAVTALLLAAVYAGWRWADTPTTAYAAMFGVATGLAVLAKFSAIPFLPCIFLVGVVLWFVRERPPIGRLTASMRAHAPGAALAAGVAALVIWAGYRFSFGAAPGWPIPLPAPELFAGIDQVRQHDRIGHLTYLLGSVNTIGWPEFYLIALCVKTPLGILLLGIIGLVVAIIPPFLNFRATLLPSIVIGVVAYASFLSHIRIGTRHVLPAVAALAIAGGCVIALAMRAARTRPAAVYTIACVLLSCVVSSITAHPDYLAYFNLIAGDKPEAFLVDSDLDWGQDVKRLATVLRTAGAQFVYFNQYAAGDLHTLYGMPEIRPLNPRGPQPGWNAISLTPLKYGVFGSERFEYPKGFTFWPERLMGVQTVGRGILLYYQPAP